MNKLYIQRLKISRRRRETQNAMNLNVRKREQHAERSEV